MFMLTSQNQIDIARKQSNDLDTMVVFSEVTLAVQPLLCAISTCRVHIRLVRLFVEAE